MPQNDTHRRLYFTRDRWRSRVLVTLCCLCLLLLSGEALADEPSPLQTASGLASQQRPAIDWSKVDKKVFCSIMLNHGSPQGPTGHWAGWPAGESNINKIVDPATGRRDLQMEYYPLVGLYDQKDAKTIKYHMDMADRMGIDSWAVWYWPPLDKASELHRDNMGLYMDYIEKHNRLARMCAVIDVAFLSIGEKEGWIEEFTPDTVVWHVEDVLTNMGQRSSYFRYDGHPVIFFFGLGELNIDQWHYVLNKVRADGYDPLFFLEVGPQMSPDVIPEGQSFEPWGEFFDKCMEIFDGVFNVNQIGFGGYKGFDRGEVWKAGVRKSREKNCIYMPNPSAGYKTYLWDSQQPWANETPRREGKHFEECWQDAIDAGARWVFLHTWNEWYEHTQLEPALEYKYLYVDLARKWGDRFRKESDKP